MKNSNLPLPSTTEGVPGASPAGGSKLSGPALSLGPHSTLQEVLDHYPGAQRALFRRYHIGGCHSCGFRPDETLDQLCARNTLEVPEVIDHILSSHEADLKMWIAPMDLNRWLAENTAVRLVDIRTREEWEAARLENAVWLSQETLQEILGAWARNEPLVIYDHRGEQALDAASYLAGHGFEQVRCLQGGIDAWSLQVAPQIPRYRLEDAA